jgi:hypothetical protein
MTTITHSICDNLEAIKAPGGLLFIATVSTMSSDGGRGVSTRFVPCSEAEADEYLNKAMRSKKNDH